MGERYLTRRFFIHPDQADPAAMAAICEHWLRSRFGWGPGSTHEWQYRDLTPHILIEELLTEPDGAPATDYKFDVFDGRCRSGRMVSGRMSGKRKHRFWADGTPIAEESGPGVAADAPQLPGDLDEMVRVAEKLGAGIDFVRVDLYHPGDRIVFGELTNTPTAGRGKYSPEQARKLAEYW